MITTEKPPPLAVSQAEAARLFGVAPQTIRRWELRGLITGNRINGGARFYPYDRLKQLVERGDGAKDEAGQIPS